LELEVPLIPMSTRRIAILGLGRSGLAMARAAKKLDAAATVFDKNTQETLSKPEVLDEAWAEGIEVSLGWDGSLPPDYDLVAVNPAIPQNHPALVEAVKKQIEVIGEIELAYRVSKAPIIAITGTNGKSTTTVMTYLCLKACGEDAVLCGNIFGSGYPEMPLTDAALASTPDQILVAEISSFQLEWVSEFKPVSAGITNIWPDHLDRHASFEEYAAVKQRIFARQTAEDFAVVKANDPVVVAPGGGGNAYRPRHRRGEASGASGGSTPTVLTFGATGEHARVEEIDLQILDQRVKLEDLPFHEPHNYVNAGMAALLAYGALKNKALAVPGSNASKILGEAEELARQKRESKRTVYSAKPPKVEPLALPKQIIDGLLAFHGLAHRMEAIGERDGVRVINNSMCTNPDAVIKSAMAVRDPSHLLIGGVNKGLDFGPLRHYLANHRHKAYIFGSAAADLNKMLGESYPIFRTLEEAFKAATEAAVKGEVIMLAPGCASTDQFRDFRDRGDAFRILAKEWLSR